MEECTLKPINIDRDIAQLYSNLYIPSNQQQCISVQITLPNNNILITNFALWDTILNVKNYILPLLQPEIKNILQIMFVVYYSHQQFEVSNHILLKDYWNNSSIELFVSIGSHKNIEVTPNSSNGGTQYYVVHPEFKNVLDTNLIMPRHILGYRNTKNGKLYKNTAVQTVTEKADNQNIENTISLAIQTTKTHDTSTEGVVEFGTQTETINDFRRLNIIKELSKHHKIN